MSLTSRVATAALTVLVFALPASAQVSAGLNEIGIATFIESGNAGGADLDKWSIDVTTLYGRFLTDRWQIGPEVSLYKAQDSPLEGDFSVFANYHFGDPTKTIVPYLQTSVGTYFGQDDGNPWFIAVGPGVKWFVAGGRGALTTQALYRRAFYDKDEHGISGDNGFAFTVGASLFFGSK